MARKGLLDRITVTPSVRGSASERADYARKGASRAMMLSLDELASNSSRLLDGETIVLIDPGLVDASTVADRTQIEDEDYRGLVAAIKDQGQSVPILVRPNPGAPGRYIIVYGRRRLRAAIELRVPVRAVIKTLDETTAVVAQGQENSARADLSFVERAQFAKRVIEAGFTKETAKAALGVDDTLLSRMLSVVEIVPSVALAALAPAKGVGRDRWEELKKLLLPPSMRDQAIAIVRSETFARVEADQKFNHLLAQLHRKPVKRPPAKGQGWASPDKSIQATIGQRGKSVSIAFSARDGKPEFGIWLTGKLDELYRAFQQADDRKPGD